MAPPGHVLTTMLTNWQNVWWQEEKHLGNKEKRFLAIWYYYKVKLLAWFLEYSPLRWPQRLVETLSERIPREHYKRNCQVKISSVRLNDWDRVSEMQVAVIRLHYTLNAMYAVLNSERHICEMWNIHLEQKLRTCLEKVGICHSVCNQFAPRLLCYSVFIMPLLMISLTNFPYLLLCISQVLDEIQLS